MSDFFDRSDNFYDRKGRPLTLYQWGALCQDADYKRVAATDVCEGVWVSTVWLGIDHGWGVSRQPVLFESMVFVELDEPRELPYGFGKVEWEGGEMRRYCTEAQAVAGHDQIVAELRAQFGVEEEDHQPGSS